ncbi:MAG: SCP2 sterol-binding domain-containing protein [Candidatus Binatia bacterium]
MADEPTVKDIFAAMPERFNPAAAKGMNSVIQYNLTGDDAAQYHAIIKDGTLEMKEGAHPSPSMTMTMAGKDFVALSTGKLNGQMAFMQGKLKIAGDMGLAMKMQTLFKRP